MTAGTGSLEARVAGVVRGVVHAAARDARRTTLVLLDDGSPEADLLAGMLGGDLPLERVRGDADDAEAHRAEARLHAGRNGLLLNPANKTVAVLFPDTVVEPVLPLADLYATRIAQLAGGWGASSRAREAIERAGGVEAVDRFLVAHLDERRTCADASSHLAPDAAAWLQDLYGSGWWWRRRLGVVPKLGARTPGIDLR